MPKCVNNIKYCSVCSKPKQLEEFHKAPNNKTGREGKCKLCRHVSARPKHLKARYNITPEEYEERLLKQGGVCQICQSLNLRRGSKHMVVDHCHTTGSFRGILCHKCNTALGLFNDNIKNINRAINYLQGEK